MNDPVVVSDSQDRTLPAVSYALYFLGFATAGLTTLAGVFVAYAQRGGADEVARSHYDFLIRTAWMFFAWCLIATGLCVVGGVLSIILVGIPILMAGIAIFCLLALWYGVRCVVGVIYLAKGRPHPRPYTWMA